MKTMLRLSASARAKIHDFLSENPGVHMPTATDIETAIEERFETMAEYVRRDDLIGAHICYRSGSPASAAYRYQVRGLEARFVARARSIDLVDISVEKLYPKTRERVIVEIPRSGMDAIQERALTIAHTATERRLRALDLRVTGPAKPAEDPHVWASDVDLINAIVRIEACAAAAYKYYNSPAIFGAQINAIAILFRQLADAGLDVDEEDLEMVEGDVWQYRKGLIGDRDTEDRDLLDQFHRRIANDLFELRATNAARFPA